MFATEAPQCGRPLVTIARNLEPTERAGSRWGRTVHTAIGHSLILASAGTIALAVSFGFERSTPVGEAAPVVVMLPSKPPGTTTAPAQEASVRAVVAPPTTASPLPPDRDNLARELHRELRRVGCYEGEISGTWGQQSRRAMKAFTERVNATLPVEQPDYILLRLVQAHQGHACGSTSEAPTKATEVASTASELKPAQSTERSLPIIAPVPVPAPRLRPPEAAVPPAPRPEPTPERPSRLAATSQPTAAPPPPRAVRENAPVPAHNVYRRPRRWQGSPNKPPKFVRQFIRNVQRSLAPFGVR